MRLAPFVRIRLRWWLLAAAVVVLAFLLPQFVSAPSGPAVKRLLVTRPPIAQLSAAEIRAAAAPAVKGGLLNVDLQAVRKRVEALAWVKRAAVRRVWPHALAIDVTAERPVARWGTDSLVDASGQVFTPNSLRGFETLPLLQGSGGDTAALFETFRYARHVLSRRGFRLDAFMRDARGEVTVTLGGGTRIELGNEHPRAMLARFVTVAAPALGTALGRAATVDMRYPNGFAVGWNREGEHG
ncbi:MAG: FtsQ-type POTRA domain-containing protein [Gammaproteobacteria bacterium]|nr:FtsQ-type POTRA domain-containing protein [Gammaproteobacteria bacterium]